MKRIPALILARLLALSLAACGADTTPTAPDDPSADAPEELTLDALRVEFAIGERDTDALMALQKELPPLLIAKLADEGVTVKAVNITFGASADATAQALQNGSIDVAFLPSETALTCGVSARLNAVENVSVPAEEYFSDIVFSETSGAAADSPIYENAVVVSDGTPVALGAAFSRALVMLCADADGNAVMRHYGCASYLISGQPGALLEPLEVCLALASQE